MREKGHGGRESPAMPFLSLDLVETLVTGIVTDLFKDFLWT